MPILGVIASGISGHLTPPYLTSFDSIATTTVGAGGVSSVTFVDSGAWSAYTHLQIRSVVRNSGSATNTIMRFNGDSGSNYSRHYMTGTGSGNTFAGYETNSTSVWTDYCATSSDVFGAAVIDILDFKNTNKYKSTKSLSGIDLNGSGQPFYCSGSWRNTSAITSITFTLENSANFQQYSKFALYGIKA